MTKNKAIFFDRDGTLNPDPGYISDPADFELFADAATALARLKKAGFLLVLITNQSGISRGLISLQQLAAVHEKMQKQLGAADAGFDGIYFCPHHPDHPYQGVSDCACRKPGPGMILQATKDFAIDKKQSFVIGDRSSDILAGIAAGVRPICIGSASLPVFSEPVPAFASLTEAVDWILGAKLNGK